MSAIDVAVVGAGLAGVSAATALVESGLNVALIDAGGATAAESYRGSYWELRTGDEAQWRHLLGEDFHALRTDMAVSPKFRVPGLREVFEGYRDAYALVTENFEAQGSLALGGLSNAWGAGVAAWDAADLRDFPIEPEDLAPGFRRVAARIGISGRANDDLAAFFGEGLDVQPPPRLSPALLALLDGYTAASRKASIAGFRLGQARNAVLTRDGDGRSGCELCAMCLWGCHRKAIYNAAFELAALRRRPNFRLLDLRFVERIRSDGGVCEIDTRHRDTGVEQRIVAARIVLAAGAIGSARLALDALGLRDRPVRLLSNPTAAFALLVPRRLGDATERAAFGLAQLSFRQSGPGDGDSDFEGDRYIFGNLFATAGLPLGEFLRRSPVSRPATRAMLRLMLPAMVVGNCFLPASLSNHELTLRGNGTLQIRGRAGPDHARWLDHARRTLTRAFRRAGGYAIPGSFAPALPGSDMHYAGTLPMKRDPVPGQSGPDGAIAGLPNVYLADAAAFPHLPAKPHTLAMMANADRIASVLACTIKDRR